ncbi:MAG: DUF4159 domain-containing protein [Thermoguttaceae bacterium]|nr:DUF4159 domain-containing protein [Thermoguttaceae bacterium]MDW8079328.1 DUF4159 domain-containing protein [Thermoguttaceae bacterium]
MTAEDVRQAIDGAVAFLKRTQRNGSWPEKPGYPGGVTALCTLALLSAGVDPGDPAIQAALTYLRKIPLDRTAKTYSVALQTMVFCRAEPEKDRALIERNVRWLEQMQIKDDPATAGAWGYPALQGDNSNSQFALLALYEAELAGVQVDARTYRLAKAYWERVQNADGSWGYKQGLFGTGSMTAAGIAALIICNGRLRPPDAQVEGEKVVCCRPSETGPDRVARALQWLGRDDVFSVSHNPGLPGAWWFYYLYGLERVGRMTSQRFIGRHDWYRAGAEQLLRAKGQASDHWRGTAGDEANEFIATSMALIFLAKGRWPVLAAKLRYGNEGDWNPHRNDLANLTFHVERLWRRDLVWQVIPLDRADVPDLLEAPVLYLAGKASPLPLSTEGAQAVAAKIRGYLDQGGFLLAECNCASSDFDSGFRRLVELVFPEGQYRLEPLPPEHPLWRMELPIPARYIRPLLGIQYGCRTSVVYIPPDGDRPSLSCLWELARPGRSEVYPPPVQGEIDAAIALGVNILAYATGRELRFKDPASPATRLRTAVARSRHQLPLAMVRHGGSCAVTPRALLELTSTLERELRLNSYPVAESVDLADPAIFQLPILFFPGRNAFVLSQAQRQRLREYVDRGGSVLADAICSSPAFAESFRREMAELFPDSSLVPIPVDEVLFLPDLGGYDLRQIRRQVRRPGQPNAEVEIGPPVLEGIKRDGRWAVIFSPYDISCALEGYSGPECQGYVREDAFRLVANVLLYFLTH